MRAAPRWSSDSASEALADPSFPAVVRATARSRRAMARPYSPVSTHESPRLTSDHVRSGRTAPRRFSLSSSERSARTRVVLSAPLPFRRSDRTSRSPSRPRPRENCRHPDDRASPSVLWQRLLPCRTNLGRAKPGRRWMFPPRARCGDDMRAATSVCGKRRTDRRTKTRESHSHAFSVDRAWTGPPTP